MSSSSGGAKREAEVVDSGFSAFGDGRCGCGRSSSSKRGSSSSASAYWDRGLVEDVAGVVRGDTAPEDAASDGGTGERGGRSACPLIASKSSSGWNSGSRVVSADPVGIEGRGGGFMVLGG